MKNPIELEVVEYQSQEEYVSLSNVKNLIWDASKLISDSIKKGNNLEDITLIFNCYNSGEIKHNGLKYLFEFSYKTGVKISFSHTGILTGLRYSDMMKRLIKRGARKIKTSTKLESLLKSKENKLFSPEKIKSLYPLPYSFLKKLFNYLFNIELWCLKNSINDIKHEQKYQKKAREAKLKLIIKQICKHEDENLGYIEKKLSEIELNKERNLNEEAEKVYDKLKKLDLIENKRYQKSLIFPFKHQDITSIKDLENIISDLTELTKYLRDNKQDKKFSIIPKSEIIKVEKAFKRSLETLGEKVFERYNLFISSIKT